MGRERRGEMGTRRRGEMGSGTTNAERGTMNVTMFTSQMRSMILLILVPILISFVISGCTPTTGAATRTAVKPATTWAVYFSPDGGVQDAVIRALKAAKQSVLVQAYSFTSAPIAKALLDAKKRKVNVQVILDDSNVTAKYSSADFLRNTGVPVYIDSAHAIAHNKIMIIDGVRVITGSFNFTKAAEERNAENLLLITDKALADRYTKNWQAHRKHSTVYKGR